MSKLSGQLGGALPSVGYQARGAVRKQPEARSGPLSRISGDSIQIARPAVSQQQQLASLGEQALSRFRTQQARQREVQRQVQQQTQQQVTPPGQGYQPYGYIPANAENWAQISQQVRSGATRPPQYQGVPYGYRTPFQTAGSGTPPGAAYVVNNGVVQAVPGVGDPERARQMNMQSMNRGPGNYGDRGAY